MTGTSENSIEVCEMSRPASAGPTALDSAARAAAGWTPSRKKRRMTAMNRRAVPIGTHRLHTPALAPAPMSNAARRARIDRALPLHRGLMQRAGLAPS